ncbi:hypothetical protein GCM10010252_26020 [Streptomyces aureoverticillatus]|nr:hypothetical protein GCM10010252_26020 [Streptomyces aureoverticillatus]
MDLLERDEESAVLAAQWQQAVAGHPRVVVVEGPAGVGKTSLLEEFADRVGGSAQLVLRAAGDELERDFGFGVVRQLFSLLPEDALESAGLPDPLHDWARRVLSPLASDPAPPAGAETAAMALHSLYRLTLSLASDRPLLVLIDDAHWADTPSLRWLHYMARKLHSDRLLIVLARRTGEGDEQLSTLALRPRSRLLRLRRLSEQGSAALLAQALGRRPEPEAVRAFHSATGGNPLLLRAVAATVPADGGRSDWARGEIGRATAVTFGEFLSGWLAQMPDATRAFASALAVLGEAEAIGPVARLAELSEVDACQAHEHLRRLGLLAPGEVLRFGHPLIREGLHGRLPADRRAQLHGWASRQLHDDGASLDQVCAHLLHVPAAVPAAPYDQWAVQVLSEAAAAAMGRGAPESAVRYLSRALAESLPAAERLEAELRLGLAEAPLRPAAAARHLAAVIDRLDAPQVKVAAAQALADCLVRTGQHSEAAALFARLADELTPSDPELALHLRGLALGCDLHIVSGALPRQRLEHLVETYTGTTPGQQALLAACAMGIGCLPGWSAGQAVEVAERALPSGAQAPSGLLSHEPMVVLTWADRLDDAIALCEAAIARARRDHALLALEALVNFRSHMAMYGGRLDEAVRLHAQGGLEDRLDMWGELRAGPLTMRLTILNQRGDVAAAAPLADELMSASADITDAMSASLTYTCGVTRALQGRLREGLDMVLAAGRWADGAGMVHVAERSWQISAAHLHADLEEHEQAVALAERALVRAEEWGTPRAIGMALHALGRAKGPRRGEALLHQAVETLEASPTRLELARALLSLGTAQARNGRTVQARATLTACLAHAEWCDAPGLVARARDALSATGARHRNRPVTGVGALTPTERTVADRAAAGDTNQAIARALHLTLRTVETHLTATYRKLGIRGRTELTRALAAPGIGATP